MESAFDIFSPQQWHVLQALSLYRFLTVDQMMQLGISKNAKSLRDKTLFALRIHNCIRSEKIGSFLPDVHHLTHTGREILFQLEGVEVESVPGNKRQPFSALFARHRFAQVDFHIGLHQWTEQRGDAEIVLELQDFIRNPRAATELEIPNRNRPVIPDGTFAVSLNSGRTALYLIEIHRTTQTKAVYEQLTRYFEVITNGVAQKKYGFQVNPVICSVHSNPAVLISLKRRLLKNLDFEQFRRNFVFRSIDAMTEKFRYGWHFADDVSANPFPIPDPEENASK